MNTTVLGSIHLPLQNFMNNPTVLENICLLNFMTSNMQITIKVSPSAGITQATQELVGVQDIAITMDMLPILIGAGQELKKMEAMLDVTQITNAMTKEYV
eukprot:TRINITY_DN75047_c0_g1_i1.p1 TRINITY_DN75047_c0_g1~~TRINITY_DN75047_c0_g1_i1.p1  ORF type:complete len:100 (-),score=9.97 TRINITY_DN75047_c0_g1_i1:13-312(-)